MCNAEKLFANPDDMRGSLIEFFSWWADIGDSYIFDLTRVKESRAIGTMSLDDFEEWGEERVSELADALINWLKAEECHDL